MKSLEGAKSMSVSTPYGKASGIVAGLLKGRRLVFIPRHGRGHTIPPHLINYRANIWAIKKLGVKRILGTTASGSMNPKMRPGELAILTQFIDFTKCRPLTFYEGGKSKVVHVDVSDPYCPELRKVLYEGAERLGLKIHREATYVCTEGPRFETSAEIRAFKRLGADLVGMTNVPECVLARELEMCYACLGIVTNFAAGISREKLSHANVIKLMNENVKKVQDLILEAVSRIPEKRSCSCSGALDGAVM
jgi:5'-methylthioadenosine phosphorylase